MTELQEKIAIKISESGEFVRNQVIDILAQNEITKRTNVIIVSLYSLHILNIEFSKNPKPDISEELDIDGKITKPASYTKQKYESIKKSKELIENLTKSVNSCLETNTQESYNKLEGFLKNAKSNNQPG